MSMKLPQNAITLTSTTSASQVDDFLQALGPKARLKTMQNDRGDTVVYAKTSAPGLFNKLSGESKKSEHQAARALLNATMDDLRYDHDNKLILQMSRSAIKTHPSLSDLRTISGFARTLPQHSQERTRQEATSPTWDKLSFGARLAIRDTAKALVEGLKSGTLCEMRQSEMIKTLGGMIGEEMKRPDLREAYPNPELQHTDRLGQSINDRLKELCKEGGIRLGREERAVIKEIAFEAVRAGHNDVLGGSISDDGQQFIVAGKVYDRGPAIAAGGFGEVVRYDARDGSESLALKFSLDKADQHDEFAKEISAHRQAAADPHKNILGFSGAALCRDGNFVIATPLASSGDGGQAQAAIHQAVADGLIDNHVGQALALTLIQDAINGMQQLHDGAGMTHIDFKPKNMFVNAEGVGMLADFGTTVKGELPTLREFGAVDNPTWQSPLALYSSDNLTQRQTFQALTEGYTDTLRDDMLGALQEKGGSSKEIAEMKRHFKNQATQHFAEQLKDEIRLDGRGYDMFALGVSAFNLLTNEHELAPAQTSGPHLTNVHKSHVAMHTGNVAPIGSHEGALRETTGNTLVDDFINRMTHPDPAERASDFKDMLSHEVFEDQNIGTGEARRLLAALMKGDMPEIRALNAGMS